MQHFSDSELIACLREGGRERDLAIEQVFREKGGKIRAYFLRHRCSESVAADLLQDTFLKVVTSASQLRSDSRIDPWLWSIARSKMLDHFRSAKRLSNNEVTVQDEFPEVVGSDVSLEVEECLHRAFNFFTEHFPEHSKVLEKWTVEDWSMQDISDFLGRSSGATREYLSQCRKKLNRFTEPCLS